MRKHLDDASVAQGLDGEPSHGEPAFPREVKLSGQAVARKMRGAESPRLSGRRSLVDRPEEGAHLVDGPLLELRSAPPRVTSAFGTSEATSTNDDAHAPASGTA